MKFSLIPALIILFAVCSVRAYSRRSYFIAPGDSVITPTTRIINITGHDGKKLVLKDQLGGDASTFYAYDNDTVIWNNQDADITILKIKQKFLRKNRFKNRPVQTQKSDGWEAAIPDYKHTEHTEHYFIKWKYNTSGKRRKYDPLIPINPKQNNNDTERLSH